MKYIIKKLSIFNFQLSTCFRAKRERGFTLLEMLIVIGIIALLSSVALVSMSSSREKTRDAQRLSDMDQIRKALLLYKEANGTFPVNNDTGDCPGAGAWDVSYSGDKFIDALYPATGTKYFTSTPKDPLAPDSVSGCGTKGTTNLYFYYRFSGATSIGTCIPANRPFYVLGIRNMETISQGTQPLGYQHPKSPKFGVSECGTWNWAYAFEWVTGDFEK